MNVLMSAYACEPGKGSEPEVGFRALLAASTNHDVWVVTRENNVAALESALKSHPGAERVRIVGLDVGGLSRRMKKRLGTVGVQWYYHSWQRGAALAAIELDRTVGFDLVHHVTFSPYWAPVGVAAVPKPLVVGPVGGGVSPPLLLLPELGFGGLVTDGARLTIRRALAVAFRSRRVLRRASLVLLQNPETGTAIGADVRTRHLSNALSVDLGPLSSAQEPRSKDVLCIGRLIPLKGCVTAVRALSYVRDQQARLVFVGDGPERGRISRLARRLGLAERVLIIGWQERASVIDMVRRAGVLVHPALHEEASLSVAEALSVGTPVVSYDHGGPAEVMTCWPEHLWTMVSASTPTVSARRIAAAIDAHLAEQPAIPPEAVQPARRFSDELLAAYEAAIG